MKTFGKMNSPQRPKGLMRVDDAEWAAAIAYFAANPKATHFKKDNINIRHSFIKVTNVINGKKVIKILALEVGEALGQGAYGKVRLAQDREGFNYAIKIQRGIIKRGKINIEEGSEREIQRYLQEYHGETTRKLGYSAGKLYVAIDYILGQTVKKAVAEERISGELEALRYAILCAKQIQKLHKKRIVHKDIHADNFLANGKGDLLTIRDIDRGRSIRIPEGKEIREEDFQVDVIDLGKMINFDLELKYDPEVSEITERMMQSVNTISLEEAISKLESVYEERLQSKKNYRLNPQALKKHVGLYFEAYLPLLVVNHSKNIELKIENYEFKNTNINEIKDAFNRAAKIKGFDVDFKVSKDKRSIFLDDQNTQKFLKVLAAKYTKPADIEKCIVGVRKLIQSQAEEFITNMDVYKSDLKKAIDLNNLDEISATIRKLNKLIDESRSLKSKIILIRVSEDLYQGLPDKDKSELGKKMRESFSNMEADLKLDPSVTSLIERGKKLIKERNDLLAIQRERAKGMLEVVLTSDKKVQTAVATKMIELGDFDALLKKMWGIFEKGDKITKINVFNYLNVLTDNLKNQSQVKQFTSACNRYFQIENMDKDYQLPLEMLTKKMSRLHFVVEPTSRPKPISLQNSLAKPVKPTQPKWEKAVPSRLKPSC